MVRSAAWAAPVWSVAWPAITVLLTLWLLLVSPLIAVLLAMVLCAMGARRGRRGESAFPWRRLIVIGLVLAYVGLALVRADGPFTGDFTGGLPGAETRSVTLPAPAPE